MLTSKQRAELYKWKFNVLDDCHTDAFPIERIHPLKQRVVLKLYRSLKDCEGLSELWVFGSATNRSCTIYSDLDVAYRLKNAEDKNAESAIRDTIQMLDKNGVDMLSLNNIHRSKKLLGNIYWGVRIL